MGTVKRSRKRLPKNLYVREGVYYARITVRGKPHRESLETRDLAEAERRLEPWLASRSAYHGSTRRTFKEAAVLWLEAGDWKPKTAAGYAKLLRVLLEHLGDLYWDEVDKAALQRLADALKKPRPGKAKGAGIATINRYLTVVSGIANHVRELPGWPEINPVALLPKKPRKARKWVYVRPPATDVEAIFARMKGTFGDLCRFALLTGARMDEIALLQRQHATGGRATLFDTKSGVPRTIGFSGEARAIVDRQPERKSGTVFNTRQGTPYKRITEMWREVVIRAQEMAQREGRVLRRLRFHDLRHEYAIRYLEAGGSLYTLQKLLGHGSIKQTERYLDYLTPEQAAGATGPIAQ